MNKSRRKELDKAIDLLYDALMIVENVRSEEQDSFDNLPDSLQTSETGETLEDNANRLDDVYSFVEDQMNELEDIKGN